MRADASGSDPAQFYTGLVADLYDALVSEPANADDYVGFLDAAGTPALELACGSGNPLVDLVARGYEVEGLDSSEDMLARCRERAAEAGVEVTLHRGEMQGFDLGRRYRSVFLAGGSFTLLSSDADALTALRCIRAHLEPGGSAMIPLEVPDVEAERRFVGRFREAEGPEGARLRVGVVSFEVAGHAVAFACAPGMAEVVRAAGFPVHAVGVQASGPPGGSGDPPLEVARPGRPVVYLTLGTIFHLESGDLLERALAGLRELPVNVVAVCHAPPA